ncbi:MAG TPA: S41 family peptidase [Longimicrobiales bacterium]|nr:S41 family peptidase [Longimicrobiales bacterium]
MRHSGKIGLGAALVATFVAGGFIIPTVQQEAGPRLFNQVFTLVEDRFVDSLDTSAMYDKAARGLVEELQDPYADLYDPDQLKEFAVAAEGRYAGVGMLVEDQNGWAVVNKVFPNTPAAEGGIQEGDKIVSLDGQSTSGWSLTKVTTNLKGPEGTKVTATFQRPGVVEPITVNFTRRLIHIPAVPFTSMLDNGIGYIPLQQFSETAGQETEDAVRSLVQQGAKGIVLDMRGNGGGLVNEAVRVANVFLPRGSQVATQRERGKAPLVYTARSATLAPQTPLVVLVDSLSASATEIVTGALQDHDRALVLGARTFGKGLVQSVFPLDGGYALKMTTGKWYTPSGRSIHRERKMINGRLVAVDSTDTTTTAPRPTFRSDAGRTLYGDGGITPDVAVKLDTLSAADQKLAKALAPKLREVYQTLTNYAWELKPQVKADFKVAPAWRDELYSRLKKAGVEITPADWAAAPTYVDRILADRISRMAFGDAVTLRRQYPDDEQIVKAVDLLKRGGANQKTLFAVAARGSSEKS